MAGKASRKVGSMAAPQRDDTLLAIGKIYAATGVGVWRSLFQAGVLAARDAADSLTRDHDLPTRPGAWFEALLNGGQTYVTEIASVLPRAIDRLSRELDHAARGRSPVQVDHMPACREMHVIGGVPVGLPVRILDASQAFAFYLVSVERAQAALREQGQPFAAVDIGGGKTPVAILGVEYRETDLGAYQELGVCFFVRPADSRGSPYEMPGTLFASLTVSDRFNVSRATPLWGYYKTYAPHMRLKHTADAARFVVDRDDPGALSITFPRFGFSRSTEIPCYTWGTSRNDAGTSVPLKTLIVRSATGEGMQVSGNVELQLGDGTQPRCVCKLESARPQACVCLMLRDLGLPKRPIANSWAEHMWADCAEGIACRPSDPST